MGQAQNLTGFQWEVQWDFEAWDILNVQSNLENSSFEYFVDEANDALRIVSINELGMNIEQGGVLFTLLAEAKLTSNTEQVVEVSDKPRFRNEWILDGSPVTIEMRIEGQQEEILSLIHI